MFQAGRELLVGYKPAPESSLQERDGDRFSVPSAVVNQ
jgi:hypothetical protein